MPESVLARGEALSDLVREDLLPEASAHGRLGYRRSLTLPGLAFPVQVFDQQVKRRSNSPIQGWWTLVGAFQLRTVLPITAT